MCIRDSVQGDGDGAGDEAVLALLPLHGPGGDGDLGDDAQGGQIHPDVYKRQTKRPSRSTLIMQEPITTGGLYTCLLYTSGRSDVDSN